MTRNKSLRERISDFIETPVIYLMGPVCLAMLLLAASFVFETPQSTHEMAGHANAHGAAAKPSH
ncbi:MAG: hypothetical protein CSA68_12420 [Rhodobacterales bacterium]|nr:MAG: hypothetical protein CSA68_12420 [Rhodobacterales bacterium]